MGNCIRKESPMQWGGEDWGSPASETLFSGDTRGEKLYHEKPMKIEEEGLMGNNYKGGVTSSTKTATEVKIKITKKQLEELLGRTDVQGLSVQQVLAQLINVSDGYESHQQSWRPALQSIPEVN